MHLEHIIPLAAGGTSAEENLWLACPLCNGYKGIQTQAVDADTGESIPLFHPRKQSWGDHFKWSDDGTHIIGESACGRATVVALQLNNKHLVQARRRWVMAGWHPPAQTSGKPETLAAAVEALLASAGNGNSPAA